MPRTISSSARLTIGTLALAILAAVGLALAASAISKPKPARLHGERIAALGRSVLAAPNRMTVYRLRPETKHHLLCTSKTCLAIWKPLTVRSATTHVKLPNGAHGKVTLLKRGRRHQVALAGHPLYTYSGDSRTRQANGQMIRSFGGTWLVLGVGSRKGSTPAPSPGPIPGY